MADDKQVPESKAEDVLVLSRAVDVLEESRAVDVLQEERGEAAGLNKLRDAPKGFLDKAKNKVEGFYEKNKDKKVSDVLEIAKGGIATIFNKDKKPKDETSNATTSEGAGDTAERALDDGGAGGLWGALAMLFEKCCSPNKKKD